MCAGFILSDEDMADIRANEQKQERYEAEVISVGPVFESVERELSELNRMIDERVFYPPTRPSIVYRAATVRELAALAAITVADTKSANVVRDVVANLGVRLRAIEEKLGIEVPEVPEAILRAAQLATVEQAYADRAEAYLEQHVSPVAGPERF